ncbi:Low density lipoprotein receptor adapter protein 1 [Amphibalanus amphitrite]|uniref:Low density lipoprotein receptor adapter protein 1 n=1 Tax=Amphibalanus amphitrite TaxID=1232801 RepID=A0A6A4WWC9_AMPAM|nr:Low density lipoprotein receptor adapter protein 1 [Amphibalanus amphitrite]
MWFAVRSNPRFALAVIRTPAVLGLRDQFQFQLRGNFVVDTDFFVRGQLEPGETLEQFIKRYRKEQGLQGAWIRLDGSAIESPTLVTSREPLGLAAGAREVLQQVEETFSCEGLPYGYYTDISNDCRVYHVCQPVAVPSAVRRASVIRVTLAASFFCNVGQVFDQRLLTCVTRTPEFDCATQGYLYAASNSQFFRDVNFNMAPAAADDNERRDGEAGDAARERDDKNTAILAEQLFSVHNGQLETFGQSFDRPGTGKGEEEEEVQYVDLIRRSMGEHATQVTAVKVVTFSVQYLGCQLTDHMWGIRHTRGPVDSAVAAARAAGRLPPLRLMVSAGGISLAGDSSGGGKTATPPASSPGRFPIERISYGVQDMVHRTLFATIVVPERAARGPFVCHVFACQSRDEARRLTCALAAAFAAYSEREPAGKTTRFAVDLRTPEQIEAEMGGRRMELESEA